MRTLLVVHAALGLILTALVWLFFSSQAAVSIAAGAGLTMFNLIALVVTWPYVLAKKLFALSVGVIVFKFAILAWIIYEVVTRSNTAGNLADPSAHTFDLGWFSIGLGTVVASVVITAFRVSQKNTKAGRN